MFRDQILILDDAVDRLEQFRASVANWPKPMDVRSWRTAGDFIREVESHLPHAALISLDHDLYVDGDEDPGDGLDAARFLATLRPVCPVIVHSSNVDRSLQMVGELENGGWDAVRVAAIGRRWAENDWSVEVRSRIS